MVKATFEEEKEPDPIGIVTLNMSYAEAQTLIAILGGHVTGGGASRVIVDSIYYAIDNVVKGKPKGWKASGYVNVE